jgi:2-methylcitrate synthase/citrate synthase II
MQAQNEAGYRPGLDGVIAGTSAICWVDPDAGLLYRGYDVDELGEKASFEEIVGLLIEGELRRPAETAQIREQLWAQSTLPSPVLEMLKLVPNGAHPMDVLRTGVSMLAMFDPDVSDNSHAANVRKAMRLVARVSTLTASAWWISQGKAPAATDGEQSFASRLLASIRGTTPDATESRAFDTVLILYAEHEFNASTFSARVTASTLAGMYAAITSAMGTLEGPLHGGANEEAMKMLDEIGQPDRAEAWVRDRLARKQKIMGFGHRVYKTGDSRVPAMRKLAHALGQQHGKETWAQICERLEAVMSREKGLCANLDLYAAPVLALLGIPSALNTPVFACARVAGWCAHVIEQHDHNRLIRPRCLYTGAARRGYGA